MKRGDYVKFLVPVMIFWAMTLQRGSGFVLLLFLPVFLAYVLYQAVQIVRKPGEGTSRGTRVAVWTFAVVLSGGMHGYWIMANRAGAETAARKVVEYHTRTGRYPASLGEAGADDGRVKRVRKLKYTLKEGYPFLTYPAHFMPLTMNEFDFASRAWRRNAY
jgi:hypothetical protein